MSIESIVEIVWGDGQPGRKKHRTEEKDQRAVVKT